MLFTAVAAIGGAPVALALPIRNGFVTILGLMLGSSFTADLLTQLDQWASGMVLMIVSVTLMTIFSVQLFRRFGHFDHITAYFSSTPGGLGLMTLIGEQEGGEARTIAMVHSARIFFTVFAIPAYLLLIEGIEVPQGPALLNGQSTANFNELMILTGCAIGGYSVGRLIRLPGYQIIGPMAARAPYLDGTGGTRCLDRSAVSGHRLLTHGVAPAICFYLGCHDAHRSHYLGQPGRTVDRRQQACPAARTRPWRAR